MKKDIYHNEYVEVFLDNSIPVLAHRWVKEPPGYEFKKNLSSILDIYKKERKNYPDLKWLAYTSELGEVSEEIEEWLNNEWDRMLFEEAEIKVHAVILGEDLFADYPMEKFKLTAEDKFKNKGVKLGIFASEEEAYKWIKKSQPLANS